MYNRIIGFLISILVVLLVSSSWAQTGKTTGKKEQNKRENRAMNGPEVGALAPDFTLPTLKGDKITLSDFRGKKPVVLEWGSIT